MTVELREWRKKKYAARYMPSSRSVSIMGPFVVWRTLVQPEAETQPWEAVSSSVPLGWKVKFNPAVFFFFFGSTVRDCFRAIILHRQGDQAESNARAVPEI